MNGTAHDKLDSDACVAKKAFSYLTQYVYVHDELGQMNLTPFSVASSRPSQIIHPGYISSVEFHEMRTVANTMNQ